MQASCFQDTMYSKFNDLTIRLRADSNISSIGTAHSWWKHRINPLSTEDVDRAIYATRRQTSNHAISTWTAGRAFRSVTGVSLLEAANQRRTELK
jgi:hypothetical protein